MQISPDGLYKIKWEECDKDAEGNIICPLQAYTATPFEANQNIYTIGYGDTRYQNGSPVKKNDKITQQQADDLFTFRINQFESKLAPMLTMNLNQSQYDALISLSYNIGLTAFGNSTILKLLKSGSYQEAGNHFLDWIYQNGKVLSGLVDRRQRERSLYFKDTNPIQNNQPDIMKTTDIQET